MLHKLLKLLFHRVFLVGCAILIQLAALLLVTVGFGEYYGQFRTACIIFSLAFTVWIVGNRSNPSYKIAWIILLLLFPIFGGLFYLIFGGRRLSRREQKKMSAIGRQVIAQMGKDGDTLETMKEESMDAYLQSRYIERYAYSGVCRNTYSEYLPLGEVKFQRLTEELEKARHYIFLEYFIIQEGIMWNTIL